jgi:predicted AAA+ superfamily ATPase
MTYIKRDAEYSLKKLSKAFPVIAVTGPRQSGKTTLVQKVFPDKPYISLEDPDIRAVAEEDPRGLLIRYTEGAVLDEVQRAPFLLSYIQGIVDRAKRPGMFILTGSQQFGLVSGITQSLAGRVALLNLLPFSFDELGSADQFPDDYEMLLFNGFYPPIYDRPHEPGIWLMNYVRTYVERDVRQLIQIRDLSSFNRFVKMCAGYSGQILNLSSLANDCGITHNTAKAWISILEASFLIYLLKPNFENFNRRLIKTPKLYFLDCGLASYLLGIQNVDQLHTHPARGGLFETMLVSEILKYYSNRGLEAPLYFWRDRIGNEIDMIIDNGSRLFPVEMKSGKTVVSDYFKTLRKWSKWAGERSGRNYVVYGGRDEQNLTDVHILPWYKAIEAVKQ